MEGQTISSISILVVDDDVTCLSIVAALLKRFNYQVVTVKHPNDALCTLRIKGGAFDLVISDVHMPDMDGFQLQQLITHEFNLPVVLMSGDNKEGVALESGAAYFISKPVSPDDLRNLWQFAAMKKTSQVVIEEADHHNNSASSVENNKDTKRKSASKEENSGGSKKKKKKQKVIWTNALHNRFLEAIRSIGLDRSVPKKILEVMNVPGLTRENVASHLQKYRIFLRRVSDASYKIHGDERSFASSRITNCNRLTKPPFGNLGANTTLFPNLQTSVVGHHLVTSITGSFLKPNLRNPNLIHQSCPSLRLVQTSYKTSPPTYTFDHSSILGSATSSANQMNYVGYKISNIKHLAESGGYKGFQNNMLNLDQSASSYVPENTDVVRQLADSIPDYQNLMPPANHLESEGLISESAFTPMNDLSEFDIMAAQQALGEVDLDCYFPDQVNLQNQTQQNGGETTATSTLNGGTNNWDTHFSSYDQASNQHDDDDEYLESLLAFGSFVEDDQIQTLDGI